MNVYEKLLVVQSKLKAPKGQFNSFGKYNYRSCEDILEALKPLLADVKAIVNLTDEIALIGDRYYLKATANFIDTEKGEKIEVSALAREDETKKGMDLAQVTGSVSSYARKYALNGLFCIDDTKDSDATNTHGKETTTTTTTTIDTTEDYISEKQRKLLFAKAGKNTAAVKEVLLKHGLQKSEQIKKSDFNKILEEVEKAVS